MNFFGFIFLIILYYPLLFLIIFYSLIIKVTNEIGHVPEYNNPDPNKLNIEGYRYLIGITGVSLVIPLLVLVVGIISFLFKRPVFKIKPIHFIISAILFFMIIITIFSSLMEWYGD